LRIKPYSEEILVPDLINIIIPYLIYPYYPYETKLSNKESDIGDLILKERRVPKVVRVVKEDVYALS